MPHVFAYGTLEIPEVMTAVTGRMFLSVGAIAHGFARFLIQNRNYPGMTPDGTAKTSGRLYLDVDSITFQILDRFEDPVYRRQAICVQTLKGDWVEAESYILSPDCQDLLSAEPWDQEFFMTHYLSQYVKACQDFYGRVDGV